ncbi:MAG: HEAT repeat domain-containing protein [Leptolyngbyaceae cyanobacterium SL_7_1]|nr:HEAT repeat domain-containing protein [Leptolyngbyaceae cyanobacterium SL_7_1]
MTKSPAFSVTSATSEGNGGAFLPAIDLPTALEQFKLGDFDTRWEMAKLLPQFGSAAIAPLIDLLHDLDSEEDDWDLPWFIAQVLGTFQHPEAIAPLVDLMQTTDRPDVAEMAATALARSGVSAIAP